MEPLQFCYWLQGFAEINEEAPTEKQWAAIREHLQTVFVKITPKTVYRSQKPKDWPADTPWYDEANTCFNSSNTTPMVYC